MRTVERVARRKAAVADAMVLVERSSKRLGKLAAFGLQLQLNNIWNAAFERTDDADKADQAVASVARTYSR